MPEVVFTLQGVNAALLAWHRDEILYSADVSAANRAKSDLLANTQLARHVTAWCAAHFAVDNHSDYAVTPRMIPVAPPHVHSHLINTTSIPYCASA